jgi:hypothetical protein
MKDRKAYNSTLRPVSKKRQAEIKAGKRPKKPLSKKRQRPDVKGTATIERLLGEGKVFKASTLAPRKPTGEAALFKEIWEEREHKCEVCGTELSEAGPSNFSHLLPKGTYPDYRLDKRNIVIKCLTCHDIWHREGPKNLLYVFGWYKVCNWYYILRREANTKK